jgi:hypothetical protein
VKCVVEEPCAQIAQARFCEGRGKQLMRIAMVRNHMVATCSEVFNKSIIKPLASLLGEPVYSTGVKIIDVIYFTLTLIFSPDFFSDPDFFDPDF